MHTQWEFRYINFYVQSFILEYFVLWVACGTIPFDLVADEQFQWSSAADPELGACVQTLGSLMAIFCTMSGRFSDSRSSLPLSEFSDEI